MKKIEDYLESDYYIAGAEGSEYDSDILSHQKAGFTLKLSEAGFYKIYSLCGEKSDAATLVIVNETANYTNSKVMVDGNEVQFEAYNINGNNYFKLRDIAKVLSKTNKTFDVIWNEELKSIVLISGTPYTEVGGELVPGDGLAKTALWGTGNISKDYSEVAVNAYLINGNNYFKLRDLGKLLNFGVDWDGANNCVLIDSANSYTE